MTHHIDTASPPTVSTLEALGAVLRYRRMVLLAAVALAVVTGTYLLFRSRTYTSSASFTPQSTRSPLAGFGALAAQLGVVAPMGEGNQSPAFYADLLRSRTILEPLVHMPMSLNWRGESQRQRYIELSGAANAPDSALRTEAAIKKLRKAMVVGVNAKTGIVKVEVTTEHPQASAILADSVLSLLNAFNVQTRRSQAAAQRAFLEQRMRTITRELQAAEDALRDFAQQNRDLGNSPHLQVQQERLNRAVMQRTQIVSTLSQGLEQAKLDEIRDTPLITVTESPVVPASPDPRGLILKTGVTFLVGLILGAVLAIVRYAVLSQRRERPERFAEFSAELAATKSDLLKIVRPLRRAAVGNGRS